MTDTELLALVKTAMRVKTTAFDTEISSIIDACKIDLQLAGVEKCDNADPIIQRAIILYCKANFGELDSVGGGRGVGGIGRHSNAYRRLKSALHSSTEYRNGGNQDG
jgi:hypothetical protein